MGCTKSKGPVIHDPTVMSNNRQESKENFFGNDRPDEEAVEVSPPKQQTEKKEEQKEEMDEVPSQPVIEGPSKAKETDKSPSKAIELPIEQGKIELPTEQQGKPVFPNYEPGFDFKFIEENQGEAKDEPEKKEDINDLIQDINDI